MQLLGSQPGNITWQTFQGRVPGQGFWSILVGVFSTEKVNKFLKKGKTQEQESEGSPLITGNQGDKK